MRKQRRERKAKREREQASSPSLSLRVVVSRVWNKLIEDEVFGRAAQLAYYWFFSLFPLLIFLTTLLAFLPLSKALDQWIGALANVLPAEAHKLILNTFHEITQEPRTGLLSFSILVTIWASSSGMVAIISSLNTAFDVQISRTWWKERLLAILLTLGLAIFIITALTLIFFSGSISRQIAEGYGYDHLFNTLWNLAQWPIVIALLFLALELIYYFAPNIKRGKYGQRLGWFTPGTIFALVFWLLISFGFRFYVSRFGNYNATYGALGGVMVLMLWLYFSGIAILVGGEINSVTRKH